ncbi:MAG: hypothetical protein ACOX7N_08450 [Lawsonibacter sp.]|jgi:chromosome segregation ATPase
MDHPFRSVMFGGFNRQDVLNYLENTAKQTAQQQQVLEEQLNRAQEITAKQDAELSEQQEQIERLRQENAQLQAKLDQLHVDLSSSRTQCSQGANDLEQTRREVEALKTRVAELEPSALAYNAIKERTAGVELEAHQRAQAVQEKAEEQAKQLRRQMEQWMQKLGRDYDALRSQVESTVSHAADKLDKAGKCLEQVTALMEEQEVALEAITQAYSTDTSEKVAAPIPIPEHEL